MFISAISLRDSPVIMGYVLVSAIVVLIANLLTDVTYSWVDPRIRYE
jgi:peptide/nickel transport system permease protein